MALAPTHHEMLQILRQNVGFEPPEAWLDYGVRHRLQRVEAVRVSQCPDCGAWPRRRLGQFVYQSTVMRLMECGRCGLLWSNVRLRISTTSQPIERNAPGARRASVRHLGSLIARVAPPGARILDAAGATGHLMAEIQRRRPDACVVVNDLTAGGISGGLEALAGGGARFDVIVLSDVLCHLPDLYWVWAMLVDRLLTPKGTLVIRVPNKLLRIRLAAALRRRALNDRIPGLDPEHLCVLSRGYLRRRLASLGFSVRIVAAPPRATRSALANAGLAVLSAVTAAIAWLTGGRAVLSPSMVVLARRG